MSGSWANADGLLLQYGTQKAAPEHGGDFLSYGDRREVEVAIDMSSLTTLPVVQSLTTFLPAGTNVMIEEVDVVADAGVTGGSSLNVGLGYFASPYTGTYVSVTQFSNSLSLPAVTTISTSALVATLTTSVVATTGDSTQIFTGGTYAGGYLGSQSTNTTNPNYITANYPTGTGFSTGQVRVRIKYRGIGTITQ